MGKSKKFSTKGSVSAPLLQDHRHHIDHDAHNMSSMQMDDSGEEFADDGTEVSFPATANTGAYIDHRQHQGLAQYHLLPARERRRRAGPEDTRRTLLEDKLAHQLEHSKTKAAPQRTDTSHGHKHNKNRNRNRNQNHSNTNNGNHNTNDNHNNNNYNTNHESYNNNTYNRNHSRNHNRNHDRNHDNNSNNNHRNTNNSNYNTTNTNDSYNNTTDNSNDNHQDNYKNPQLTNLNLKHLERRVSNIAGADPGYAPVALDMDEFAREQRLLAGAANVNQIWDHDLASSINSLEFGGSNPLSDHSSDSTSLDDVCFPDYYDIDESTQNVAQWPDLKYLAEFVHEELEELQEEQAFLIQQQFLANMGHDSVHGGLGDHVSFPLMAAVPNRSQTVLPTDHLLDGDLADSERDADTAPLLGDVQESQKKYHSSILNKNPVQAYRPPVSPPTFSTSVNDTPKPIRFTYFREDMEKTVHSATVSGLLRADPPKERRRHKHSTETSSRSEVQKKYTLEDLFAPNLYSKVGAEKAEKPENRHEKLDKLAVSSFKTPKLASSTASSVKDAQGSIQALLLLSAEPSTLTVDVKVTQASDRGTPAPEPMAATAIQQSASHEQAEPAATLATPSMSANKLYPTHTPNNGSVSDDTEAVPFWLDVLDPTEEEMKVLSKTFGIHPLTTEDIFLGEAREKVELFKSYYFICFTSFDVVHERRKQRAKEYDKKLSKLQEMYDNADDSYSIFGSNERKTSIWGNLKNMIGLRSNENYDKASHHGAKQSSTSVKSRGKKVREGELSPLNMYMIVFKDAVITFHFSATPHPVNVRRRARMLKDYLTVSSDWICYAIIDDITDSFAPMIESIEVEVNSIEDAILKMHSGDTDSEDDSDSSSEEEYDIHEKRPKLNRAASSVPASNVFFSRKRTKSTVESDGRMIFRGVGKLKPGSLKASSKSSTSKSSKSSHSFKIIGWKRKGDMLRRIGECRKRVMSILRLLGSKADVIKGFSKRFSETSREGTSKVEIEMYLSDIQDHIVTMVQSLNHYEKLLARFHSNYLAQINIDMTKVNNDTNDALGKITILGTIVLPINIVTGLWGMNCIVPGQEAPGLTWFYSIVGCMILFSIVAYNFARRVTGL